MYKLLIVGHMNFPSGVLSAINLLMGKNENIFSLDLDQSRTHEEFEIELKKLLDDNEKVIVLADLTGGAPHQIASRLILESGKSDQFVISGINLALVLDIAMKFCVSCVEDCDVKEILSKSIEDSRDAIMLLGNGMV